MERGASLDLQHLSDCIYVQEAVRILPHNAFLVDSAGGHLVFLADQLRCSEEERQSVKIIKSPSSMRASRLLYIYSLQSTHDPDVRGKDQQDRIPCICLCQYVMSTQNKQHRKERGFVTRPIVDARFVPEGAVEVVRKLEGKCLCARVLCRGPCFPQSLPHQGMCSFHQTSMPLPECFVAKAHGLLQRREIVDPPFQLIQDLHKSFHNW
mmetsp:Transcript_103244/g.194279  ORF Transcript_103244/g.194279 Transcript_103244/m.194279 type:complete len:209 (+) Transcript_103244:165-791(+)